jgi:membrane protein implicated in regulation of membrane protease activity
MGNLFPILMCVSRLVYRELVPDTDVSFGNKFPKHRRERGPEMEWTGISIFYASCLGFGFFFALMGAIFGEIAGHFHVGLGGHHIELGGHHIELGGHHIELGHHGVHIGEHGIGAGHPDVAPHAAAEHGLHVAPAEGNQMPGASVFNTITLSTFMAFFGIAGLVAVWGFHLSPIVSLACALPSSMIVAAGQFTLFVKVFVHAQASSEATMSEVLGSEAQVTASIPGDRVGQIAYVIKGSRFTAPAVSADGHDIARGTRVYIVNIRGTALVVRPI